MRRFGVVPEVTHGELLARAAENDQSAWNELVDRFGQMVWSVARGFGLDHATAKDVTQTVWLKLVENCDRIKEPERLPGWLATTCKREAMRVVKLQERTFPTEFEHDIEDQSPSFESIMIEDETRSSVVEAFRTLSEGCQQLLRLLTVEPALSYEEISDITDRPIGSLGPTRSRCLDKLRASIARITGSDNDSFSQGGERP